MKLRVSEIGLEIPDMDLEMSDMEGTDEIIIDPAWRS